MSEIIYETLEKRITKKLYLISEETKFEGVEYIITGVVKGKDSEDAKKGLDTLEQTCQNSESILIPPLGNLLCRIISLKTRFVPSSNYQSFTLVLGDINNANI